MLDPFPQRRPFLLPSGEGLRLLQLDGTAMTNPTTISIDCVTAGEAFRIASEGYVFGYPLVWMNTTRRVRSNFSRVCPQGAPINQFLHRSEFHDASLASISKNSLDTICSTAWLDLAEQPLILSLPDMGRRYHMIQMFDAWANVFSSLGTRTIGSAKTYVAITGPSWKGSLPIGLRQIKAPTNLVFVMGRIQVNSEADCAVLRKIQTHYKLAPLSAWDKTYFPPDAVAVDHEADMTTSPDVQIAKMDGVEFFTRLSVLLRDNPASAADTAMMARLRRIGVSPEFAFSIQSLPAHVVPSIRSGAQTGRAQVEAAAKTPGIPVNGWEMSTNTGRYGSDYLRRAAAAQSGLGVSSPEDAIHLRTTIDCEGDRLSGKREYVLHFPSKKTPPVRAFWSLTLYDAGECFVENPIRRYTLGSREPLVSNPDGSLNIYIQQQSPYGEQEANWLPAPAGEFSLVLRLYWPKSDIWEGRWALPAVRPGDAMAAVAA